MPKSYHDAINQIQIFADSIKVRHESTLVPMDEIGQEWWSSLLNDEVQVQWLVNTEKPEIAAVRNIYDGRNRTAVLHYSGLQQNIQTVEKYYLRRIWNYGVGSESEYCVPR